MLGEHCSPVSTEVPAPEFMKILFFSRVTFETARATPEFGTSTMMSTPSWSNHCRAMFEPVSGLFWWSADTKETWMPFFSAPKSSTAILAALTDISPEMSR